MNWTYLFFATFFPIIPFFTIIPSFTKIEFAPLMLEDIKTLKILEVSDVEIELEKDWFLNKF